MGHVHPDPDFVYNERGELCHAPAPFDVTDDAIFHDMIGANIGKPSQQLCQLAETLIATGNSFGVDYTRLGQEAAPLLIAFLKACRDTYRESL